MDASRITRAWLVVAVALCAATSCDVETEDLETEDDLLRDDEPSEVDETPGETPDALVEVIEPPEPEPLFPTAACRPGFVQAGARLCINQIAQNAERYRLATVHCRDQRAQICSYEDLTYLYYRSALDANYNPNGQWIGNVVADDQVLCGNANITFDNDPDMQNFEGTCSKNDQRSYWCCHDDE